MEPVAIQKQEESLFLVNMEPVEPVGHTISVMGKMFSRDKNNPILNLGVQKMIDIFVRKVLLARAGWITKLTVPLLLKNYSSHLIADHKKSWVQKLFSWIGPGHANGKTAPEPPVPESNEPY